MSIPPVNLRTERRKQILTLAVMALCYVPFLILSPLPESGADSIIAYVARQTGYLAAVLLLWQFLLGTRSISALVHADQAWALSVHKKIGIYGIALVIAHPLLIAYTYSEDLLYVLIPDFSSEFAKHVSFGRIAFLLFLFVWFTSAILRAKIGYRPWKYIHYLTYIILPLVLLHTPEVGSFYAGDSAIRIGWKVLTVTFVIALALRLRQLFTYGQYPYTLTLKKEIASDIFLYKLEPVGKKIKPSVGQFVYVRRSFWSEEHPFSVAQHTEKTGTISIAAKVFGTYTKKLSVLPEGSTVYLDGPYGVFTQEISMDSTQPTTLIAGGIGITPFIQHALGAHNHNVTLFSANRGRSNIVLRDLMQKTLGDRYVDILSADDADPTAEKGYVTVAVLKKKLGDQFSAQQFYICGPPIMMNLIKKDLLKAGIPPSRIHTEEFGF